MTHYYCKCVNFSEGDIQNMHKCLTYTLYGSLGSDVNVILNVTLAFDLNKKCASNKYQSDTTKKQINYKMFCELSQPSTHK